MSVCHTDPKRQRKDCIQTLSHSHHVCGVDIRPSEDMTSAILVIGLDNGDVAIYRTPLSRTQLVEFQLLKCLHAHTNCVNALHLHAVKPLFVSASNDYKVKIWDIREMTTPILVKCIVHPSFVFSAKYSLSALLLVGCSDCYLRVYGVEPQYSLLWRCKLAGPIYSVAWSPSNHFAASFYSRGFFSSSAGVHVWNSNFNAVFQHKQDSVLWGNYGLSYITDDLLLCSGWQSNNAYLYNIPKRKVVSYMYPMAVRAVTALNSEFVCTSCCDDVIRVYKLHGHRLRLLATLPHRRCMSLASCLCLYEDAGYVIASADWENTDLRIDITSRLNRYWIREVTKIIINCKILPFCRNVYKIIFKYL